jgi:hypothetical protein
MSTDKNDLLVDALREDLERERAGNQRSMMIGGGLVVILAGYLAFLHGQVAPFFEPEELALFATGAAIEAAPEVEAQLRDLMVESAPDIARSVSTAVVEAVPTYREVLEAELKPVMDEASMVMAGAAVSTMLKSERAEDVAQRESLEAAADAVVGRLDRVFEEALHERADLNGPTPAELIDQSVDRLVVVDRGLRRLARGGGDAAERELVLTVLGVIDGVQQDQATVEKLDYKANQAAAAKKAEKADSKAKPAAEPAKAAKKP